MERQFTHLESPLPASPRDVPLYRRPPQVGFVGLGALGYPMARSLATRPFAHSSGTLPPLIVWNRTPSKARAFVDDVGALARVADTLEGLVMACDVVVTNLAADDAVRVVFNSIRAALEGALVSQTKIFVETSTILPALAGEVNRMISRFEGAHFISCPVFGQPSAARAGALLLAMAGDSDCKKEVAQLLVPTMGRKIFDLGEDVEKAPAFKLVGNSFIIGVVETVAEAFTFAEKAGVGAADLFSFMQETIPSPTVLGTATTLIRGDFDGSNTFSVDGAIKDAGHMRALAAASNCQIATVETAHQNLLTARALHKAQEARGAAEFEVLDFRALVAGPRLAAGLDPFYSGEHSRKLNMSQ